MSNAELQTDLLERAAARLPDDALRAVRRAGLSAFAEQGLPGARDEDWKYTNLAAAAELSNDWLRRIVTNDEPPAASIMDSPALPEMDAHFLVLADGIVDEVALQRVRDAVGDTLRISRLREHGEAVAVDGPFDSLNAALLQDGLHIEVPAGKVLDKPLAILLHDGAGAASQTRIVVSVREQGAIDLVEYHQRGESRRTFANVVTQLDLATGARAALVRLQDRDRRHVQVGKLAARLARDASLQYASFDLGGALIRQDVFADITGPGASVSLHGLYLADGEQHIDNHTRIDHRIGPATSREEYRGILNGKARCVFNGKAIVHEGADGSDAEQANHNLLLSRKAEVDTKPELEIYAEDVKCSHGATVGELDESALFYLRSRGLSREQAAHILTRAFAGLVLALLPIAGLHRLLETRIDARLDELLEEKPE